MREEEEILHVYYLFIKKIKLNDIKSSACELILVSPDCGSN